MRRGTSNLAPPPSWYFCHNGPHASTLRLNAPESLHLHLADGPLVEPVNDPEVHKVLKCSMCLGALSPSPPGPSWYLYHNNDTPHSGNLPIASGSAHTLYNVSDVTRLLDAVEQGEPQAAEELLPLVYEELRRLAAAKMANEKPGQTLQPTALVHEAWIRLLGPEGEHQPWNSRGHFFGAAAEAMRRILVDRARQRLSEKHGGHLKRLDLSQIEVAIASNDEALLAVATALDELATEDPECAQLVRLRFFAGLTMPESAAALRLSERSAHRAWAYARAWLYDRIKAQLDA